MELSIGSKPASSEGDNNKSAPEAVKRTDKTGEEIQAEEAEKIDSNGKQASVVSQKVEIIKSYDKKTEIPVAQSKEEENKVENAPIQDNSSSDSATNKEEARKEVPLSSVFGIKEGSFNNIFVFIGYRWMDQRRVKEIFGKAAECIMLMWITFNLIIRSSM